uniref:Sinapine esterase n=1 Tax=Opuntia streptacantha TaxID=393608 RepID=A0A7C8YYD0_OPUST
MLPTDMNTTSYTELQKVIKMGAIRVVVPGNFPIGCISAYAATFATEDPTMYDELGCLKRLNDIAKFYIDHLQQGIRELQKEHPHTVIIYGDYFHGLREVLRLAPMLGFDKYATLTACCGAGDNKYNYNSSRRCGDKGTQVCPNPYVRVNWDGPHLTSHAYEQLAKFLLKDIIRGISQIP